MACVRCYRKTLSLARQLFVCSPFLLLQHNHCNCHLKSDKREEHLRKILRHCYGIESNGWTVKPHIIIGPIVGLQAVMAYFKQILGFLTSKTKHPIYILYSFVAKCFVILKRLGQTPSGNPLDSY